MSGVTTNENLRKRWNANRAKGSKLEVKTLTKFKKYYWEKLPESKIEKYYELRKKALAITAENK